MRAPALRGQHSPQPGQAPRDASRDDKLAQSAGALCPMRANHSVLVDLSDDPSGRCLLHLVAEPPGTRVVLDIPRGMPAPLALDELRNRGRHLTIEVRCPHAGTRQLWLDSLRWGVAQWVR